MSAADLAALRRQFQQFLFDPQARRDPRPLYDALLAQAPVLQADGSGKLWVASGYPEIIALTKNPGVVNDFSRIGLPIHAGFNLADVMAKMLPMRDGADHTRLRTVVGAAFSARNIAAIRAEVETTVADLLSPALERGSMEFVADLARPLPVALSCAMLNIPASDRSLVSGWAQTIAAAVLISETTDEAQRRLDSEIVAVRTYIDQLCRDRAKNLGADLISYLLVARKAGILDEEELFAFVLMLFVNGLDTLTSGLTVAAWHLLQNPERWAEIAGQPAAAAAEPIFDECLRLAGPVRASGRAVVADTRIGDQLIPAGSGLLLLFAAANRDPRKFPDPDRLDPRRTARHLAFGYGPHHCLGAALSVLAGGAVLNFLARHCAAVHTSLSAETAPWDTSFAFAGLHSLPLTLIRRPALSLAG